MDDGASPKVSYAEKNNWFSDFLKKLNRKNADKITEQEIISMVNEGQETGVLQANEVEMIQNIIEFTDKEAKDIMTHRSNICALDGTMNLQQTLDRVLCEPYSRFPVFLDDIDNIIGILHIKEVMAFSRKEEYLSWQIKDIEGMFSKSEFIPETRKISDLFQKMQAKKAHMVIVVDEYGQTSGLVALEDILEEIVGNIFDEHDKEKQLIEQLPDGSYQMHGMADFDDVMDILRMEPEEEYDTLNGFLIAMIDRIPTDGETFSVHYGGYHFHVTKVENKMIRTVQIKKE
ncbi:Magnesium and cobalt efflux protein CorC [Eubacterium plexicaudatum ASF492]|uniref:CBS domain-containing protein n=1 Tax=Eubacterium plexicaudatum ASF492 TaxID=1235802 RepID=N2B6L1_9FIRM|nr:Magnesium and cobalt efflux protein CorC [Eubacterium plexicaudatum ASF492]